MTKSQMRGRIAIFPLWLAAVIALGITCAAWFVVPLLMKPRLIWAQPACINNLNAIAEAKAKWAHDNDKTNGSPVIIDEVNRYITNFVRNPQLPDSEWRLKCPEGGVYSYNVIGSNPTCTVNYPVQHATPWVQVVPDRQP